MTIAVAVAFDPGVALAVGVFLVVAAVLAASRRRGLALASLGVVGGAVLLFPFAPTIAAQGGLGLWSGIGQLDPWLVLRGVLGDAPGAWSPALFLPVGAVLGLALASDARRGQATRAAVAAAFALALAWLSSAGYLPTWASNGPAYLALATVCEAFLIGDGLASAFGGMGRASFGFRQIGTVLLSGVLVVGLVLQALAALVGSWAIGGAGNVTPAWSVLDARSLGEYNIVWVGAPDGQPFPAPGGDPTGIVQRGRRDDHLRSHRPLGRPRHRHGQAAHRRRRPSAPSSARRDHDRHHRPRRGVARTASACATCSPIRIACPPRRRRRSRPRSTSSSFRRRVS